MRGRQIVVLVCAFGLVGAAGSAWADDVFPPDWEGQHNTVEAAWDYWGPAGVGPGIALLMGDQIQQNPDTWSDEMLAAYAHWSSTCYVHDSLQGRQSVLEVNPGSGLGPVGFALRNFDEANPVKRIRIQITFYSESTGVMDFYVVSGSTDPGQMPWPVSPWVKIDAIAAESYDHGDGWQTNAYDLTIEPNPAWENILLDWGYTGPPTWACYIDQVVINTQCPEPATLSLLVLGACLPLLRRRRRR